MLYNAVEVRLPHNLTANNIHFIQKQLDALVERCVHERIVVHADGVVRADTAGLQLLRAFALAARERHIALEWDHPSARLCNAAEILGMNTALGLTVDHDRETA